MTSHRFAMPIDTRLDTSCSCSGPSGRVRGSAIGAALLALLTLLTNVGCGGGGGGGGGGSAPVPPPTILNINNATNPMTPVGLAVEINGDAFVASTMVRFTQGMNVATVTPDPDAIQYASVLVLVPASGNMGAFTVPGDVTVEVLTDVGTSNARTLSLVPTVTFDVNNVTWGTTTALPTALRGHVATTVPRDGMDPLLFVAGGNDGTNHLTAVQASSIAADGSVAAFSTTTALPAARAFAGVAVAHAGNAPVLEENAHVYVLGGQADPMDTPGGTATAYVGSVSLTLGTVTQWTETTALPEPLIGAATATFNGFLYVAGGLRTDGTPSPAVYSAAIGSDGELGPWSRSPNDLPTATSFGRLFGFAGRLYMIGGDPSSSTDPNDQSGTGVKSVFVARAQRGGVAAWGSESGMVKQRMKHGVWAAFGQLIAVGGVYNGSPGSQELERSTIQGDGSLSSWNSITSSSTQINANTFNAAVVVSPQLTATNKPRLLLIGGETFTGTTGALSATIHVNTAP